MRRCHGYLSQRPHRWGDRLQIASGGATSGAFVALLCRFPEWVPAAAAARPADGPEQAT